MSSPKYPRTPHLPWSPGMSNDDRMIEDMSLLLSQSTIITEKLDGGNICMTSRHVYARSHTGTPSHPLYDLAKRIHAMISPYIPEFESWFFEWTYGVASITYAELPSPLHLIGIRDDDEMVWASWRALELQVEQLNYQFPGVVHLVPRLAERTGTILAGTSPDSTILQNVTERLAKMPSVYGPTREGVVIRLASSFEDKDFDRSVAKWVREGHVQTDEHWMSREIIKQKLSKEFKL